MLLLMIAGVGAIVAGVAAIWFGIPVKEFSFGNTMILAGVVAICSGLMLIGVGLVVRELKTIRRRLQSTNLDLQPRETDGPLLPAGSIAGRGAAPEDDRFAARHVSLEASSGAGAAREHERRADAADTSDPAQSAPAVAPPPEKPRRNLLFSSSLRKERDQLGAPPSAAQQASANRDLNREPGSGEQPSPHPSFDHTWPRVERASRTDISASRSAAPPSVPPQASPEPMPPSSPAATVVKSGVVDGMAYSLYSDGSIEAQMPEGMMRFASIEQLRDHLDRAT